MIARAENRRMTFHMIDIMISIGCKIRVLCSFFATQMQFSDLLTSRITAFVLQDSN